MILISRLILEKDRHEITASETDARSTFANFVNNEIDSTPAPADSEKSGPVLKSEIAPAHLKLDRAIVRRILSLCTEPCEPAHVSGLTTA